MNSFESYTLIIGAIAILIETVKHLKKKVKAWSNHV